MINMKLGEIEDIISDIVLCDLYYTELDRYNNILIKDIDNENICIKIDANKIDDFEDILEPLSEILEETDLEDYILENDIEYIPISSNLDMINLYNEIM